MDKQLIKHLPWLGTMLGVGHRGTKYSVPTLRSTAWSEMDNYSSHLTTVLSYDKSMNRMLSSLREAAFESDPFGLTKGFLKEVTLCISEKSLGCAVGTNKPKSRVFSHRPHIQSGWIGNPSNLRHRSLHLVVHPWSLQQWEERMLTRHWHLVFHWSKQIV